MHLNPNQNGLILLISFTWVGSVIAPVCAARIGSAQIGLRKQKQVYIWREPQDLELDKVCGLRIWITNLVFCICIRVSHKTKRSQITDPTLVMSHFCPFCFQYLSLILIHHFLFTIKNSRWQKVGKIFQFPGLQVSILAKKKKPSPGKSHRNPTVRNILFLPPQWSNGSNLITSLRFKRFFWSSWHTLQSFF